MDRQISASAQSFDTVLDHSTREIVNRPSAPARPFVARTVADPDREILRQPLPHIDKKSREQFESHA